MAHRLLIAALFTFVVDQPVLRTLFIGIITAILLCLTAVNRPFRSTTSFVVQCVLLICLVVLSLTTLPVATQDLLAVDDPGVPGNVDSRHVSAVTQSKDVLDVVVVLTQVAIPTVAVTGGLALKKLVAVCRCVRRLRFVRV